MKTLPGSIRGAASMSTAAFVVLALALTSMTPARAAAQTGALALDYPLSARSTAMGYAGVADRSDPANIYFNPANVTALEGAWATGSYRLLLPGIYDDIRVRNATAGAGYSLGAGRPFLVAVGLTLGRLSYGRSIVTLPDGTMLGEYDSKEDVFGMTAGVASTLGERVEWSLGFALRRWKADYAPPEFTIEGYSGQSTAWMVDLGGVVGTTVEASDWSVHPALALAAVNLGSDIEFEGVAHKDPLPSWFNYGFSVRVDGPVVPLGSNEVPALSVTLDADGNHGLNEQSPRWSFGYELVLMDIASVRWGRRTDDRYRRSVQTWGVAAGIPVGPVRARVEYTNLVGESMYGANDVYGAMLVWRFGGRKR